MSELFLATVAVCSPVEVFKPQVPLKVASEAAYLSHHAVIDVGCCYPDDQRPDLVAA